MLSTRTFSDKSLGPKIWCSRKSYRALNKLQKQSACNHLTLFSVCRLQLRDSSCCSLVPISEWVSNFLTAHQHI